MDVDLRAQRRQFIRLNHPDRGGDPERFEIGLQAFEGSPGGAASTGHAQHLTADADASWPISLTTRLIWTFHRPGR